MDALGVIAAVPAFRLCLRPVDQLMPCCPLLQSQGAATPKRRSATKVSRASCVTEVLAGCC